MCTVLTVEDLRQNVRVDPETGKLWWLLPPRSEFQSDVAWKISCARRKSREAFATLNSNGYRGGRLNGSWIYAHVAIFALVNGVWPSGQIDHIDGNPANNRAINLRDVSASDNQRNQARKSNNRSGYTGVHWHAQSKSWRAQIKHGGKTISLGLFPKPEAAAEARAAANDKFGYHKNHGRAA